MHIREGMAGSLDSSRLQGDGLQPAPGGEQMSLVKRWRTTALAWAVLSFWLLADLLVPNIMAYSFSGYDPQTVPTSTLMTPRQSGRRGLPAVDRDLRGSGVIVLANLGPLYLHTASPPGRPMSCGFCSAATAWGVIGMAVFTYDPMNPAANTTGLHSMAGYLAMPACSWP